MADTTAHMQKCSYVVSMRAETGYYLIATVVSKQATVKTVFTGGGTCHPVQRCGSLTSSLIVFGTTTEK